MTPVSQPDGKQMNAARWVPGARRRLRISELLKPSEKQAILIWAGIAGMLAALVSVGFRRLTEVLHAMLAGTEGNYVDTMARLLWWQRIAILAGGGLAASLVLKLFSRWTRRSAAGDYMEAILVGDGVVPARASIARSISALFSISSGASIGREGPLVQLGAMMASLTARWRKFAPVKCRLLVACGAAGGIASAYNAPIAGALFVAEILLGTMAMETFGPLVFASVISTIVTRLWFGQQPLYQVPSIKLGSNWDFWPLLTLGITAGFAAPLFLKSLDLAGKPFARIPATLRPAVGGLLVGGLACYTTGICGNGHTVVDSLLNHRLLWHAVLTLFFLKWVATCVTFGSGTVGGVFTPTLFLGASLGSLTAALCAPWWPGHLAEETFVLVGMGAFLAATTHAPIMAILMIFEMTLDYEAVLPLMLACVVAHQISHGFHPKSIYAATLRRKGANLFKSRLARLRASDLLKPDPPRVDPSASFSVIAQMFITRPVTWIYVTRLDGTWLGGISLHDVKSFLQQSELASVVIASDILRTDLPAVTANDSMEQALEKFAGHEAEALPVLTNENQPKLTGSLSKNDLLLALAERQTGSAKKQ
ncbi:MAG TPA: ClcB-like voltage-gated chloride channel protein [Verrucomicrobiales bacterium]|nr:ClcB-like voltage-gated chloride channel protein [Verrucomicrobiales bacterium]